MKRFVSTRIPAFRELSKVRLRVDCPEIYRFRRTHPGLHGVRSLMHTQHHPWTVCAIEKAGSWGDNYLVGLFLHEFGHLGSGGGEQAADEWVLHNYGIVIHYMGPLEVEWVNDRDLADVLGRYSSSS